jgi:hypothetical protein
MTDADRRLIAELTARIERLERLLAPAKSSPRDSLELYPKRDDEI